MWAAVFNACGTRMLFQQRRLWETWIPPKQSGLWAAFAKAFSQMHLYPAIASVNNIFC